MTDKIEKTDEEWRSESAPASFIRIRSMARSVYRAHINLLNCNSYLSVALSILCEQIGTSTSTAC